MSRKLFFQPSVGSSVHVGLVLASVEAVIAQKAINMLATCIFTWTWLASLDLHEKYCRIQRWLQASVTMAA
ncbi:hypothetical protein PSPTOT1_0554 [Pseudomonas syringae pv. tomato T1]|nr:hypothetical protein PSPTOT1_0554 [Pseudomonas syringae pv. tomato T1]KPX76755.1 hypothetical protein ALO84_101904 [Pseudomonas syringae pv. maculicola]